MADYSTYLRDENNNVVYPKTLISDVIFDDGSTISIELAKKINANDVSLINGILSIRDVQVDLNEFGSVQTVKLGSKDSEPLIVENKTVVIPVDTTVTEGSNNLVTSDAVAKVLGKSDNIRIVTKEEYKALQDANKIDEDSFYIISDNESGEALPYIQSFDATNIVSVSKTQYANLVAQDTIDQNTIYVVTDSEDVNVVNAITKRISDLEALVSTLKKDNVELATRVSSLEAEHAGYLTAKQIEALIDYKISQK